MSIHDRTGRIAWQSPDRGCAFIAGDDGARVFLGSRGLREGVELRVGDRVRYKVAERGGRPEAYNLVLVISSTDL